MTIDADTFLASHDINLDTETQGLEITEAPSLNDFSLTDRDQVKAEDDLKLAFNTAVALLTRREYARSEIGEKLNKKGFSSDVVESTLYRLVELGYQSDERFATSFTRSRIARGHGPQRIKQDLKQKKIDSLIIDAALDQFSDDFIELIEQVRQKKFKVMPEDFQAKQKQSKFLMYRGFTLDQIERLWSN